MSRDGGYGDPSHGGDIGMAPGLVGAGLVFDIPVRFRVLGVPEQHEIPVHSGSWSVAKLQVGLYHESAGSVVVLVRAAAGSGPEPAATSPCRTRAELNAITKRRRSRDGAISSGVIPVVWYGNVRSK